MPDTFKAKCNAEVPFTKAIAFLDFVKSSIIFSKMFTYSPTEETYEESIQSDKFSFSKELKNGSCKPTFACPVTDLILSFANFYA